MYHAHFKGTHRETGFRWGAALAKNGNFLLRNIPFPITEERRAFAAACRPVYERYFPQILEEIGGIARGQGCAEAELETVLFSMYALPPVCCCSCFAVANGGEVLLGRNSDFLPQLEKYNMNVIYRFDGESHDLTGNTTAFVELEDGVNDCGLAAGLTAVAPKAVQPGLNAGMLVRWLLERCASVSQALEALQDLPLASAQTITLADRTGDIAVAECCAQGMSILRPSSEQPFVWAVNRFYAPAMAKHNLPGVDDWQAAGRAETLGKALSEQGRGMDIPAAQGLLSGREGFICQYDRAAGKDTVWSVVYDLRRGEIHRCEGNPGRSSFRRDDRFPFSHATTMVPISQEREG